MHNLHDGRRSNSDFESLVCADSGSAEGIEVVCVFFSPNIELISCQQTFIIFKTYSFCLLLFG